jgi:DNA-binding NtrC family response regulator
MKKGNLLIVDDEIHIVENLQIILREKADKIFICVSGKEALAILEKEEIHCVVSDLTMPSMSGVELLKSIREKKNEVPFIFYIGHGSLYFMKEAAKYGAFDFLEKPYFDDLMSIVPYGLMKGMNKNADQNWDAIKSEYEKLLRNV